MCFTTDIHERFKVADKDIVCYKIMCQSFPGSEYYDTPFMRKRVRIGETIKGNFANYSLNEANFRLDNKGITTTDLPLLWLEDEVVHAFKIMNSAQIYAKRLHDHLQLNHLRTLITEWTIPKGALYMDNYANEIVATEMKFNKVIK